MFDGPGGSMKNWSKEIVASDAAADEQKALRQTGTLLPHVRMRIRDGAHAAGRLSNHVQEMLLNPPFFSCTLSCEGY